MVGFLTCLLVLRWLQFLTFKPEFGYLIKTIFRMAASIFSFMVIFMIFIVAFAALFSRIRNEDPRYASLGIAMISFYRAAIGDFEIDELLRPLRAQLERDRRRGLLVARQLLQRREAELRRGEAEAGAVVRVVDEVAHLQLDVVGQVEQQR